MPVKIDLKDKKILCELDLNSRLSASKIGKRVGLSREVVNYRIRRLMEKKVINYFYIVLNTLALGYNHYKIYFKLQNVDPKIEEEIIDYFVRNENTIWVATCMGNWDLGVSVLAKSPIQFGEIYQRFINDYGEYFLEKNVSLLEKAPTFNRAYLLDDLEPKELEYVNKEEKIVIDELDHKILSVLSTNARIPIVELGKKLNLTRDILTYRIKKMEKIGLIQGFRTSFNLENIGYSYYKVFFTFKNLTEKRENDLISYCKYNKNIVQYIKLIGQWDAEIEFEVRDSIQLRYLLLDLKKKFSDIIRNYEQLYVQEKKLNYYPFS